MKKKISILLMSAAVVIIAGILVGGTGSTATGAPLECTDGTYFIVPYTPDELPFPRQYNSALDPEECAGGWVWEYLISADDVKDMSAITKVHIYIPSLPPNNIDIKYPINVYRGVGAQSTGKMYGNGIYNGVVVTTTPLSGVSGGEVLSFCTDVNTYGTISIGIETSKTITGCAAAEADSQGPLGGIIGPGFNPSQYAALETDKRIQLGADPNATVCAKKHPVTGCIKYFYACSDTSQNPLPLPSQFEPPGFYVTGTNIVDMGNLEDPLCREAIFAKKNTPVEYWGYANGKYYCIGVYDAEGNPVWVSPCP